MRSVKLILVLIIFGAGLIVAAVVPTDMNGAAGASRLGSWVMGLLGAAFLFAGLALLRQGYLAARKAQGGAPLATSAKLVLGFSAVAALAALGFVASQALDAPKSPLTTGQPGVMSKQDYIEQEQREIKRRQSLDKPAPAPEVPAHASP